MGCSHTAWLIFLYLFCFIIENPKLFILSSNPVKMSHKNEEQMLYKGSTESEPGSVFGDPHGARAASGPWCGTCRAVVVAMGWQRWDAPCGRYL